MKRVSAVVLAAGPSRRYVEAGHGLKQLLSFDGESLVRRATRAALGSNAAQVIVVIGCQAGDVEREVEDLDVEVAINEHYPDGQSSSVRAGLARVERTSDGALFVPCDQPLLSAEALDAILEAWDRSDAEIVVPTFGGERRAPVLFDRSLFDELSHITGDSGGRQLFAEYADRLLEVEFRDELPLLDIDSPDDFRALLALLR